MTLKKLSFRNGSVIVYHTVKTINESFYALNMTLQNIETNGLIVDGVTYIVNFISLARIYGKYVQ